MNQIRKHYYFSGMVQGVGFRWRAYHIACSLGLTGWVRNNWDGRVEMEVQGSRASVEKMLVMLQNQRYIDIWEIEDEEIPAEQESGFHIR